MKGQIKNDLKNACNQLHHTSVELVFQYVLHEKKCKANVRQNVRHKEYSKIKAL